MEPYHPYPGESGTRSGAQLVRSVDFYNLHLGRDHPHPTRCDAAGWAVGVPRLKARFDVVPPLIDISRPACAWTSGEGPQPHALTLVPPPERGGGRG